jgi:hypothetical protein
MLSQKRMNGQGRAFSGIKKESRVRKDGSRGPEGFYIMKRENGWKIR